MLLQSRGVSLAGMRQVVLHGEINDFCDLSPSAKEGCDFFASSPDGLAAVMTDRLNLHKIPNLRYEVFSKKDNGTPSTAVEVFSDKIRTCLNAGSGLPNGRAPVAVLVNRGKHWILIYDWFENASGKQYRARWPEERSDAPALNTEHNTTCTMCPGGSDMTIPETDLHNDIKPATATGVEDGEESPNGYWEGRRVLLVPIIKKKSGKNKMAMTPQRARAGRTRVAITAKRERGGGIKLAMAAKQKRSGKAGVPPPDKTGRKRRELPRKGSPLTAVQAVELVQGKLDEFAGTWPEHAERLATAKVPAALRVDRLDAPEDSYYLVPVVAKQVGVFLLASAGIGSGSLGRAAAAIVSETGVSSPGWLTQMPEPGGPVNASRHSEGSSDRNLTFTGRLVWQPCFESPSPLRPFAELKEGDQIRYLDFRGRVHDKLTTDGAA